MLVIATQRGYYGSKIQDIGDEFALESRDHFSDTWMKKVIVKRNTGKSQDATPVKADD